MAAKKIVMPAGDFIGNCEAMAPFQILTMVGHTVHTVVLDFQYNPCFVDH